MNEREMPDLPPGTSVNGAIVEELVERGGYGTVYRARDKLTGTLFALKFVPLHRAKQWAEREGILAMSFQHRNLVRQVGFSNPGGLPGPQWKLPKETLLSGRLHFGDGRAYVHLTEARTPTGDTFKVCLEAGKEGKRGIPAEPDGGPDTAKIFSSMGVMAVRRFE